jgi:transcriptional regulator of met regulon
VVDGLPYAHDGKRSKKEKRDHMVWVEIRSDLFVMTDFRARKRKVNLVRKTTKHQNVRNKSRYIYIQGRRRRRWGVQGVSL